MSNIIYYHNSIALAVDQLSKFTISRFSNNYFVQINDQPDLLGFNLKKTGSNRIGKAASSTFERKFREPKIKMSKS